LRFAGNKNYQYQNKEALHRVLGMRCEGRKESIKTIEYLRIDIKLLRYTGKIIYTAERKGPVHMSPVKFKKS
jgi:hypothetical protein